jgi:hypothetical protein
MQRMQTSELPVIRPEFALGFSKQCRSFWQQHLSSAHCFRICRDTVHPQKIDELRRLLPFFRLQLFLCLQIAGEETQIFLDASHALRNPSEICLRICDHLQKTTAFNLAEFNPLFNRRDLEFVA